jgi:phage FluMu protein Com
MQNSSSEKLQTILLQAHQADSIQCPACKQFNDWHIDTSPYEEQEKKEKEQQQYFKDQCYNVYFMTKEMLKMSLNHQFLDHQKIKESVIYCSHCQHPTDAMWLWISFIFKGNDIEINTLKNLMYSAPAPILTAYLLQKYQEMELRCPHCNTYENYYITHTP